MPQKSLFSRAWDGACFVFFAGVGAIGWVCSKEFRAMVASIGSIQA